MGRHGFGVGKRLSGCELGLLFSLASGAKEI